MVGRIVFLTDRPLADALPAILSLGADCKTVPLAPDSLAHLRDLSPAIVVVDRNSRRRGSAVFRL